MLKEVLHIPGLALIIGMLFLGLLGAVSSAIAAVNTGRRSSITMMSRSA